MPWTDLESNRTEFLELLSPLPRERILDVGAGRGIVAGLVWSRAGGEVCAVEPDWKKVAKMQKIRPQLKSYVATAESLPFRDSCFDKVYSTVALHHFANNRKAIQEIARVLKPGGLLLIVEIKPRSAQGRLLRFFENGIMRSHLKFLEMNQLAQIVGEMGSFRTMGMTGNSYVYFIECVKRD